MGFEVLLGACEHCKSEKRGKGNSFMDVYNDPNVSKETEVVDFFTQASDNSIMGLHKILDFPHFEYRTRICKSCLERYETTNELINQLNSDKNKKWRNMMSGDAVNLQVDKVLIIYLDRDRKPQVSKNKEYNKEYKIIKRKHLLKHLNIF